MNRRHVLLPALALIALVASACHAPASLGPPAVTFSVFEAPRESPEAGGAGRVVPMRGGITSFSPADSATTVDAAHVKLRQVLEDLGDSATEWYQHVQTLSDPFFEGRGPGTRGQKLTVDYVEFYLRTAGLEPAFPGEGEGSYRQPFIFERRDTQVEVHEATLEISGEALEPGRQFVALGISGSGKVNAPVTFVGYGVADGPDGYTSFDADTELTGRVALLLRYAPLEESGEPRWEGRDYRRAASMARKLRTVARRGAAAILLVNPPGGPGGDDLEALRRSRRFGPGLDVPALQVTPEVADRLLRQADPQGRGLMAWRRLADEGTVSSVDLRQGCKVVATTDVERKRHAQELGGDNVGGILRGYGSLADQWVVIGAHHDHVGYGEHGGTLHRGQLHPGADDNASGTAGVLVLAGTLSEAYAEAPADQQLRSILFLTFDAEEMGLHGSRHFVDHAPIDLDDVSLLLNMDMIGRLRSDSLLVLGTGTAEGLGDLLLPHVTASGLTVTVNESGSGRSDDASFHRHQVPGLHFFTGMHAEYTSPRDEGYTVNPGGAARVLELVQAIAMDVAARPDQLAYRRPPRGPGRDRGYAPVRLGIQPGMDADVEGAMVDDVFEHTTAAEAGIEPGDVIIGWDGLPITGLGDLFEQLQLHQPGDVVTITVFRDGVELELKATLQASEGRQPN